jgi:hypothetical protein
MNKSEIYVEITNDQERLRAIEILEKAGERVYSRCYLKEKNGFGKLTRYHDGEWIYSCNLSAKKNKITLQQLEEMLMPKSIIGTQSNNPLFIAQRYIIDNFPPGTVVTITNGLIEVK